MSRKKLGLVALFGSTAVLSLFAALGAITSYAFDNEVLPHTMVAGVSIGGMSYPAAQAVIDQKATELSGLHVTFKLNDKAANASLQQLGVTVDSQSAFGEIVQPKGAFKWLSPSYWRSVFTRKTVGFGYIADQASVKKNVETALGVSTTAHDAQIKYVSGKLMVEEGQAGLSVSSAAIDQAIRNLLANGEPTQITLDFTEQSPNITTAVAAQTVTQVESQLIPVSLQFEDQQFGITPEDQYSFLDFVASNGELKWQVSESKIKSYLANSVAKKVNIVMLSKITQADTQQVTQEGRDGREMDSTKLAHDISRAITQRTNTATSPIVINTRTIPFTEKTIYPNYVAGLYVGLYADINLSTQQMFILDGSTLVNTYLVSTGMAGLRTPPGQYYVCNKIPLARSPLYKSLWMPTWNALSKSPESCAGYVGYGVHGLPCFNSSCTLTESPAHLGRPVSHGCVRLPDDGARWFYDNMPIGTPVYIHS